MAKPVPRHTIDVDPERLRELDAFINERVERADANRIRRCQNYDEIDRLLDAEESRGNKKADYENASQVVTSLTQSRTDSIAERVFEAFSSATPVARMTPVTGKDSATGNDWHQASREGSDWFDYNYRQPNRVNGLVVTRANISDLTRYGLCGIKVLFEKDQVKGGFYNTSTSRWEKDAKSRETYSGPRWHSISPRDMLWPEGYGQDLQSLPFFGQLIRYSWSAITAKKRLGFYDEEAVERMKGAVYKGPNVTSPNLIDTELMRTDYEIAEIWLHFDIDGDGIDESILVDWHMESRIRLRCVYNPFRIRPIFVARLRERSSVSFDGKGIPDILKSAQEQSDAIHNVGLDAARVAMKSARLIRMGSALGNMLLDPSITVGPDFEAVTESPDRDMVVHPLGDPGPAMLALRLLDAIEDQVNKLVGIGPGQLGDVSLAVRSAATGIGQLLHEGGYFTRGVSSRYVEAFVPAILQTFEVVRRNPDTSQSYAILGDDGIFLEKIFALKSPIEYSWAVKVSVANPSDSPDAVVQRNLIIGQFMLSWLREVAQGLQAIGSSQVEESVKVGLYRLLAVSEEIVRRIMENSKDMQDLTPIMPGLKELVPQMVMMAAQERAEKEKADLQMQDLLMRRQGLGGGQAAPVQRGPLRQVPA